MFGRRGITLQSPGFSKEKWWRRERLRLDVGRWREGEKVAARPDGAYDHVGRFYCSTTPVKLHPWEIFSSSKSLELQPFKGDKKNPTGRVRIGLSASHK